MIIQLVNGVYKLIHLNIMYYSANLDHYKKFIMAWIYRISSRRN